MPCTRSPRRSSCTARPRTRSPSTPSSILSPKRWPTTRSSPSGGRGCTARWRAPWRSSTPTSSTSGPPCSPTTGRGPGSRSRRRAGAGARRSGCGRATWAKRCATGRTCAPSWPAFPLHRSGRSSRSRGASSSSSWDGGSASRRRRPPRSSPRENRSRAAAATWGPSRCSSTATVCEGAAELERVDRLAREEGDVETLGITHGERVVLARVRGDAEAALTHARETLRIAERLGSPFFRAGAYLAFGQAHILGAEWTAAREALEKGLAIARAGGAYVEAEPLALAWLAAAHLGVNDTTRARAAAEEALAVAQRRRTRPAECIAYIGWARVLIRTDGVRSRAAIEASLERALAFVEETGAKNNEPFIRVQRARLAALAGDGAGWRRELETAHRLFRPVGAVPRADRLARELALATGAGR